MKFPPEEVESRRWQKIADELGNRTAKQVLRRLDEPRTCFFIQAYVMQGSEKLAFFFLNVLSMTLCNIVKNQVSLLKGP